MSDAKLNVSRRIRATPYTSCVEKQGVSGYSVVNHTVLPKGFRHSVSDDYWHLKQHVQLWDVGCQRQVEIRGKDAAYLTQLMTPRDLRAAEPGQCLYAPLVDEQGHIINDPVILKLASDRFWLSIADADILLWAKGLAYGLGLDVSVHEPDVWPLAVQGPKSDDLMQKVFGETLRSMGFFRFKSLRFKEHNFIVARSGYSKQGGFEIYLDKPQLGPELWEALWEAGAEFNIRAGSPNLIERIEAGLISFGNEMTPQNNPLECGLQQYCQLDGSIEFIGLSALQKISRKGPQRLIRGLIFDGKACPPCQKPWPVLLDGKSVGQVTSAIWSPRFNYNIALAMLDRGCWDAGSVLSLHCGDEQLRSAVVSDLPMTDDLDLAALGTRKKQEQTPAL